MVNLSLTSKEDTPLLYKIEITNEIKLFENALPIQRKVYDLANMMIYEYYNKIKESSTRALLTAPLPPSVRPSRCVILD